jgi:hypothetical protein
MIELFRRVRPIVYVLWIVALARLVVDMKERPEIGDPWTFVSVYYASIPLLIWASAKGRFVDLSYPRMLGAFAIVAVLCWAVPNSVAYTTAQFNEWTFGRYRPPRPEYVVKGEEDSDARSAPVAPSVAGKIGTGLMVGGSTSLIGFGWLLAAGTLIVYVPERLRRRRAARVRVRSEN